MEMTNLDNINQLLIILGVFFVMVVIVLSVIFVILMLKDKNNGKNVIKNNGNVLDKQGEIKKAVEYNKESIFDFMEFEKIEDNMIIQKKGKFLMVIECQGINYDLMSEMEKVSVEQGFLEFLNTLRNPIQIYVQTKTVNLEQSVERYKEKLDVIEKKYNDLNFKYQKMKKDDYYDEEELQRLNYDVVKQRNLFEYTKDVINNIEKTSLNNNVLNKKYYIILPYHQEEMETGNYSKEEIQSMVFSELYTRARSIINTLFSCQVNGKVLDSMGLIDLLYSSYNRDEADVFRADKALKAGYEDLYSTAADILGKKMEALDKEAERRAIEFANEIVEETKKEKEYRIKKENLNNLVMKLAKGMIEHDKAVIGEDIAKEAIETIEKKEKKNNSKNIKEGGTGNELEKEKNRRGRPRKGTE